MNKEYKTIDDILNSDRGSGFYRELLSKVNDFIQDFPCRVEVVHPWEIYLKWDRHKTSAIFGEDGEDVVEVGISDLEGSFHPAFILKASRKQKFKHFSKEFLLNCVYDDFEVNTKDAIKYAYNRIVEEVWKRIHLSEKEKFVKKCLTLPSYADIISLQTRIKEIL